MYLKKKFQNEEFTDDWSELKQAAAEDLSSCNVQFGFNIVVLLNLNAECNSSNEVSRCKERSLQSCCSV